MSSLRVGVDPSGETARVVEIETADDGTSILTCRTVSTAEIGAQSGAHIGEFVLAIDDSDAVVRIVRPAIIDPALTEQAAKYEAEIALLSNGTNLSTQVRPISTAGNREWLAISVHESAMEKNAIGNFYKWQNGHKCRHLPRSIALGTGLLFACEPLDRSLTVVVQPAERTTSICFLSGQSVIGAARLSKVTLTAPESEVAGWLAELKMVVDYRLSTDLAAIRGGQPPSYVWAGAESELDRLRGISPIVFAAPQPKVIPFSARSEVSSITPEWLVALGAALN